MIILPVLIFVLVQLSSCAHANAEGKIVEYTVSNLENTNELASNKFRIQLYPSWAPIGVQRFEELTTSNFWENTTIFRIAPNFVSQFGINSNPDVQQYWNDIGPIKDDPVMANNDRGKLTFATSGADSRTTQLFINTGDNRFLDGQGFSPIGEVLPAGTGYGGMEVVDAFYSEYLEEPDQFKIRSEGESYLSENYPNLSYFVSAEFIDDDDEQNNIEQVEVVINTTTGADLDVVEEEDLVISEGDDEEDVPPEDESLSSSMGGTNSASLVVSSVFGSIAFVAIIYAPLFI